MSFTLSVAPSPTADSVLCSVGDEVNDNGASASTEQMKEEARGFARVTKQIKPLLSQFISVFLQQICVLGDRVSQAGLEIIEIHLSPEPISIEDTVYTRQEARRYFVDLPS